MIDFNEALERIKTIEIKASLDRKTIELRESELLFTKVKSLLFADTNAN